MIALCEDNEKDRKLILDMLDEWGRRTGRRDDIRCFPDAAELLDAVLEERVHPDLLLMDIYFDGQNMTGIDAVSELRKEGVNTEVVFLTTSPGHALEAYGLDARQYLVKPVEKERLFRTLEKCRREQPPSLLIKMHGGTACKVLCGDILYCETQGNDQTIHLCAGTEIITRLSSAKMREALQSSREFISLGPSYIINLLHVVSLGEDSVVMEGGKRIHLSHKRFLEFRNKYFDFFSA